MKRAELNIAREGQRQQERGCSHPVFSQTRDVGHTKSNASTAATSRGPVLSDKAVYLGEELVHQGVPEPEAALGE